MKTLRLPSALALLLIPALVHAADFEGYGTSIFRLEQKAAPGFDKKTIIPFTQFAGADLDQIADGNLSLHLYGWERVDLGDRSTSEKNSDGDLSYGFLAYRFPKANAEVKGGRFFVNQGVASEQLDGVGARTDLAGGFGVSAFGGAPVKLDRGSNTKGDFIAGGRGSYRYGNLLEVGFSGLHETGGIFDPTTGVKRDRELIGGDLWCGPSRFVEVNGHTYYDMSREGVAEHSYQLLLRPFKTIGVSGLYNQADLVHFYAGSNLRSLFNPDQGGMVRSYGGTVTWYAAAPLELNADYRHIHRSDNFETELNGGSDRFGAEARITALDKKLRSGVSYHRVSGATGFNSYHEGRGYVMYDSGRYIGSLDAIGQIYQTRIYNSKNAFELIASTGMRIMPQLTLSGELSYGQNPRLADDLKGLVRLTFNYVAQGKGAKK
ncbi:hypothetical protein [Geomesophilobacter sediminis]|uniref:Porin n=1 Tax=Geomesophilobacter sediminis TaxID=2798584 RepID=A0A8J7LUJ0_9BACT|nr:hypothetical protein [Geomesophilobacter sediminis]MBJ6723790.1 hypothetical protein [Geomesophilobacter sediminis]